MSEVRCGTCAHFRGVFPELNLGECARLEFRVLGDAAHIHAGIVSDANMERFVVSPSFGCVYHDPRDDEEGEGERVMSRGEVGGYLRTWHRVVGRVRHGGVAHSQPGESAHPARPTAGLVHGA